MVSLISSSAFIKPVQLNIPLRLSLGQQPLPYFLLP